MCSCSKACRENRRRGDVQDRMFWAKVKGCSNDVEDLSQRVRFGEVAQDRHDDDWTQTTSNNDDNTQPSQRPRRGRPTTPRPSPRPHQPTTTTNDDNHARLDVNMKCVLMCDPPLKLSGGGPVTQFLRCVVPTEVRGSMLERSDQPSSPSSRAQSDSQATQATLELAIQPISRADRAEECAFSLPDGLPRGQ